MGITSLVLSLVALILLLISPWVSLLIALVALALGIAEVVKRKKDGGPKSFAIVSIVLSSINIIAFGIIIVWSLLFINNIQTVIKQSDDLSIQMEKTLQDAVKLADEQ